MKSVVVAGKSFTESWTRRLKWNDPDVISTVLAYVNQKFATTVRQRVIHIIIDIAIIILNMY